MNIETFQRDLPPPTHIDISYPRDNRHIIVTWNEVKNPDKHILNKKIISVNYNVYKGLTQNGIFYKLNNQPLTTNRFEDYDVSRNPQVQNWYKVSTVYKSEDTYIEGTLSQPVCFQVHNTDRWFLKMNERNLWILKNTGMLFDLYTRKYDGERCPQCYDPIRGRAGSNDCAICYGTGFVGGYDPAFQLYVRLKPAQQSLDVSNQMYVNNTSPGAWTISDTQIKNRDILISPVGTIYQVINSMINQAGGYLFHQEMNLKVYDPNDAIYDMKRTTLYPRL